MDATDVIQMLGLEPLPDEGGYYKETYRSDGVIPEEVLPNLKGNRSYSTLIFYLVTPESFSSLHRVKSDEIFHFYSGDPVKMIQIDVKGNLKEIFLGSQFDQGQKLQTVVEKGIWQGTKLIEGGKWALMGCTVAPGFEFEDTEIKTRSELVAIFPDHRKMIEQYTHR